VVIYLSFLFEKASFYQNIVEFWLKGGSCD
jgi:hypothetical protein